MKKREIPEPIENISMADPSHHPTQQQLSTGGSHQVSGRSWVYASVASLATGGPLLGISGLSFLASLALLLMTSPLLLLFSPLIFGAAVALAGATASFSVLTVMGLAGIAMFVWIVRSVFRRSQDGISSDDVVDMVEETGEKVKENGQESARSLQQLSTGGSHQVTVGSASVAGLATGGPLLGISGFSFLISLTLLLITSSLLLLFSPLIFGAALVLGGATTSFGVVTVMGLAGIALFVWIVRSVFGGRQDDIGSDDVVDMSGEKLKENGQEWAGYLQQKVQENIPIENSVDRG